MTYRVVIKPYRGYDRTFTVSRWEPHPNKPHKLMEWRLYPDGVWKQTCFCKFVGGWE